MKIAGLIGAYLLMVAFTWTYMADQDWGDRRMGNAEHDLGIALGGLGWPMYWAIKGSQVVIHSLKENKCHEAGQN